MVTKRRADEGGASRRDVLKRMGALALAWPAAKLLAACDDGGGSGVAADTSGADTGAADTNVGGDSLAGDTGTSADTTAATSWATGGTAVMSGDYADPFASGLGAACALTCAATLGPCYAQTVERQDISEGHDGLPTRLALKIVDTSCNPVAGATVDIWHCGPEGLYSGSDASNFCTSGDATARAARWFRGVQTTDDAGRVDFDTCFPGWYSSRTIHIHFTIRVGGTEYVTSQLVFPDALDDEIVNNQPLYKDRGARDTTNTSDTVMKASSVDDYTFEYARQADGAMLAWKAIVLRSSTGASLCQI